MRPARTCQNSPRARTATRYGHNVHDPRTTRTSPTLNGGWPSYPPGGGGDAAGVCWAKPGDWARGWGGALGIRGVPPQPGTLLCVKVQAWKGVVISGRFTNSGDGCAGV